MRRRLTTRRGTIRTMTDPDDPAIYQLPVADQLPVFLDQHREMILGLLNGLTEAEARRSLVPSKTTLLGLVKHATFVEQVWFSEAVTGRSRAELGIVDGPDESFALSPEDTIVSVTTTYTKTVRASRAAVDALALDEVLLGNRRGPLPLGWVCLHVLRELAQHCGHGDILREQILAQRSELGS
ncbi:DinB family protein [Luteococcus sanguinis]